MNTFLTFHKSRFTEWNFLRYANKVPHTTHDTQGGEAQSLTRQRKGMKALSVSKASSVDWRHRELVGPKPVAMMGRRPESSDLSLALPNIVGVSLEHRLSEALHSYGPYKVRCLFSSVPAVGGLSAAVVAEGSVVWGSPVIP